MLDSASITATTSNSSSSSRSGLNDRALAQSLAPARATSTSIISTSSTSAIKRNHQYDLLSLADESAGEGEFWVVESGLLSPHLQSSNTSPATNLATAAHKTLGPSSHSSGDNSSTPEATTTIAATGCTKTPADEQDREDHRGINLSRSSIVSSPCNIVKPKPKLPILRTASTKSVTLVHPAPGLLTRSSSRASNIAQLEATAEKLSMTSSIDSAIRDLHDEQKRGDSRRSSILAASLASATASPSGPEPNSAVSFSRQVSTASSILETNNAARLGGYSPAGYVMSPHHSLLSNTTTRLRSGSYTRTEPEPETLLSRGGLGKSSTRSTMSATAAKPSLTGIAEMETSNLTLAVMDEADKLPEEPEDDEAMSIPHPGDIRPTSNEPQYQGIAANANDYWDEAVAETGREKSLQDQRPTTPAGSACTFEQAERAFADFDGAHCSPDAADLDNNHKENGNVNRDHEYAFESSFELDLSLEMPPESDPNRPRILRSTAPTGRPKSYMDPESGQQMLYYPARVPLMLNLPQKLSKNPKAAVRNKRRSQILSAMPEANRQNINWLPEVVPEPLLDPLGSGSNSDLSAPMARPDSFAETRLSLPLLSPETEQDAQTQARPNPRPLDEEARKSRVSFMDHTDKRKSRMSGLNELPPQLRASAFFDLPSESPQIELKDGSATATLDSILDASAHAPVSAFTDHAFAGRLGTEVYGADKKRRPQTKRDSQINLPEVKKRSSFFRLRTPSKLSLHSSANNDKTSSHGGSARNDQDDGLADERQRLSGSVDGAPVEVEGEDEGQEESSGEEPGYNGPPTTLLAELHIRKQQQKMRTQNLASAYPNGMHSTLLERDTIAEFERKNRKAKKVNLAWEDPNTGTADNSDDEDLPLGLLMASKNGATNLSAFHAEMNRPLGLMERRELEDNEPLSRRRGRLQGHEPGLVPQRSMINLRGGPSGGALGMSGGLGPPSPRLQAPTPEADEIEGETLGQRMRRLRAREDGDNLLPRARPVSGAFSVELLSQLGDTFKADEAPPTDVKGKQKVQLAEEEETLGQRRRRLQAEREAREREMGTGTMLSPPTDKPISTMRHSMADVLGASGVKTVLSDPRLDAEKARREEAARFKKDQEQKFAALRAQMPSNLSTPTVNRSGGYMAGQFNDGTGGGLGTRASVSPGSFGGIPPAMNNGMTMQGNMANRAVMANAYSMGAVGGGMVGLGVPNGYTQPMTNGYGMPLHMQMPTQIQQPGQQYDRVDRWRQSIVP
ncbi:uncharacterized protein BCR38DRAFT_434625 [Pseudomassariella vexata]|uniref:Uncharacterized protein n=1 Tax=Pseudomassariella vexata TaxID=1141098 RepID=A0A1Y2DY94_9PEZI|nr:uncharacterized protein BCR38DRAFT_434625 [Pseudomassariella vexata]ORY64280.1 hypothetical protein BCR38DRAFT_434625 [Pseudomassariella vexata]